ncbi:hypothetical protein [Microbacterium sp.]|uniref:hypothetical protein n=1 Tax=Microbacterium sp. TaxID=51671 RepID=UPI002810F413|nr:hypothetical protein [Microbacterium sp.]
MATDELWTDRDDAELALAALPEGHPVRIVESFVTMLLGDSLQLEALAGFVTPEARDDWSDFSGARGYFMDQALASSTVALRHRGAADVAYVKLVPNVGPLVVARPRTDHVGFATLVWRRELGGWRVHAIGEPIPPALLPRTSRNDAPEYAGDRFVQVERD